MRFHLAAQYRERILDPAVKSEFDQLIASINLQSNQTIPSGDITTGTLLTADPLNPPNDSWWVVRIGNSPAMVVSLKARINGVTQVIATITI